MSSLIQSWTEKYRPKNLESMVVSDEIRAYFTKAKEEGNINGNILLVGHAGIGKTSLAKMIADDILNCDVRYINASDENGIDTVRTKILQFVRTASFDGKKKVIILDEIDGFTSAGQMALRNSMEEYSDRNIFILTANYGHKIKSAVRSRCKTFDIEYKEIEYVRHMLNILKAEKVKADASVIPYIKSFYPDFRRCLNDLEKLALQTDNNLKDIPPPSQRLDPFVDELWDKLHNSSVREFREHIIKNEATFTNDYHALGLMIFNYVCDSDMDESKKSSILIILGEALRFHPTVLDAEINLTSKLLEVKAISV